MKKTGYYLNVLQNPVFILFFTFGILLLFMMICGAKSNQTESAQYEMFLQELIQRDLVYMDIYYSSWYAETRPILPDRLKEAYWYRVTINLTIGDGGMPLVNAFKDYKMREIKDKGGDFRLGCVFYDGKHKEKYQIFFSNNAPFVLFNNKMYEVSHDLVQKLIYYLPDSAQNDYQRYVSLMWIQSGMSKEDYDEIRNQIKEQLKTFETNNGQEN